MRVSVGRNRLWKSGCQGAASEKEVGAHLGSEAGFELAVG